MAKPELMNFKEEFVEPETMANKEYQMSRKAQLMLGMMTAMGLNNLPDMYKRKSSTEKQCLTCRNTHTHTNDFCSAECCKVYKLKERAKQKLKKVQSEINLKQVNEDNGCQYRPL